MQGQGIDEWEKRVAEGDFEAVPEALKFNDSFRLAYLIDGYELAGGFEALAALAEGNAAAAGPEGRWMGDARMLWMSLFFEHRRYRHFGTSPEGADAVRLDRLCQALRRELLAIAPGDRSAFLAALGVAPTS